ncbi:hypothetical protein [Marinicrinis sediminis]|uniref:Uncharacterized protein n=1 Tax=Marinicrinis sediminis TaxID=1652465 RepID=A0ABW5RFT3_9BACL
MMKFVLWLIALAGFVYSIGYAVVLWKQHRSRTGAVAVTLLAISLVVLPFFIRVR